MHAGTLVRLRPGAYLDAAAFDALRPEARHRLRVRAAGAALGARLAFSHLSAAAVHGLPLLFGEPDAVHVTDSQRVRGQRWSGVVKHPGPLDENDVVTVDGVRVTTVARTCIDVAAVADFASALAVVDAALHGSLVSRASLERQLADRGGRRGSASAARVAAIASERSDSAGESYARALLLTARAPEPELQHVFVDARGRIGPVDFWWERWGIVLEFDGDVKYQRPEYLRGRSAAQVALDERKRERRILALPQVRAVVRADWRDLRTEWRLQSMLAAEGLPFGKRP